MPTQRRRSEATGTPRPRSHSEGLPRNRVTIKPQPNFNRPGANLFDADLIASPGTTKVSLITIPAEKTLRLLKVKIVNTTTETVFRFVEIFFGGSAATLVTAGSAGVDLLKVPIDGEDSTQEWGRGAGPNSGSDKFLYVRFTTAPAANSYTTLVWYTLEAR